MSGDHVAMAWPKRVLVSAGLLGCGLLVFVFGTNYYSMFPTNDSQVYRVLLMAAFLAAAVALRRRGTQEPYGQIAYAFFVATVGFFVTSLTVGMRDSLFHALNVPFGTALHSAVGKLFEALLVVSLILLLMRLWGQDLGSLYLRKGRLGLGLFVGLCLLVMNAATAIVTGSALGLAGEEVVARLPWALVFSLANGLMEEVWFRGLFLRRLASAVGMAASIIVISVFFTVSHAAATYMNPAEAIVFQAIIFPMSLLLAYLMHKTDSVWGSVLYHAGGDVFLFYLMGL